MKGEFYKMEFDAWDEGTVELTLEEEAAYLRLCHQMYRRRGPMPNSEKLLCALWRCHPNKARPLLQKLIEKGKIIVNVEGHLTNTRVTQEVDTRETLSTRRAHAGHTGGIRSGEVRRNSLNGHDEDEAHASSKTNQRREEERREDSALSIEAAELPLRGIDPFTEFWKAYPHKIGKADAAKAWATAAKRAKPPDIMAGLRRYIAAKPADRPWCNPSTFLNQDRWADEPAPQQTGPPAEPDRYYDSGAGWVDREQKPAGKTVRITPPESVAELFKKSVKS